MRFATGFWLVVSAIGAGIIALPDDDQRLISFGEEHGPAALDAVGILFVLTGWVVFLIALWRRRSRLWRSDRAGVLSLPLFVAGIGAGLVIAQVVSGFDYWWAVGVVLLLSVQLWAAYQVHA